MGRGRQKAKQTKVARELKYHTLDTDLTKLEAELSSGHGSEDVDPTEVEPDYSKWIEEDEEEEEQR